MDKKKELQAIFEAAPFIEMKGVAKLINMDKDNFRNYVMNPDKLLTEKTYLKIKSGLALALENFTKAMNP